MKKNDAMHAVSGGEPPTEPAAGEPAGDGDDATGSVSDAQIENERRELEAIEQEQPAGFDVEAFVRSLPDGVTLCPQCLGVGGVVAEPPFDPYSHLCMTCLGWGKLRTGSTVGGQGEIKCRDCDGNGYRPNDPGEPPATPAEAAHFAAETPPRDHQGRTPDDPDFDWSRVVAQPAPGEPEQAPEPVAVA